MGEASTIMEHVDALAMWLGLVAGLTSVAILIWRMGRGFSTLTNATRDVEQQLRSVGQLLNLRVDELDRRNVEEHERIWQSIEKTGANLERMREQLLVHFKDS